MLIASRKTTVKENSFLIDDVPHDSKVGHAGTLYFLLSLSFPMLSVKPPAAC